MIPVATAFYGAFILGFAGLPGAILTEFLPSKEDRRRLPILGLAVTALCQSFVSVAFVVFVVLSVYSITSSIFGFGRWILWFLAFFVAIGPALKAAKTAARIIDDNPVIERVNIVFRRKPDKSNEDLNRGKPIYTVGSIMPNYGALLTFPVTVLSFFLYSFFPQLTEFGWSWLPHY